MTSQQEKDDLTYQHRKRIESAMNPSPLFYFQRRRLLKTIHPETIPTLVAHGYNSIDHQIPENFINECVRLKSFAYLNDLAEFLNDRDDKSLPNGCNGPIGMYALIPHMKGLRQRWNPQQKHNPLRLHHYSQASPEERAVQRAILNATMTINRKYTQHNIRSEGISFVRLASFTLARYIADNPDKAEDTVTLFNERGMEATEQNISSIDSLIANRNEIITPLTEGAL